MSQPSAYLIPLDSSRLATDEVYRVLQGQISTSLDLIEHDTRVGAERERLAEVWNSFLDHVVRDFGSEAIPLDEDTYQQVLQGFSDLSLRYRTPWVEFAAGDSIPGHGELEANQSFAIVPRGSSRLDGSDRPVLTAKSSCQEVLALPEEEDPGDPAQVMAEAIARSLAFPSTLYHHEQIIRAAHAILYEQLDQTSANLEQLEKTVSIAYWDGTIGCPINLTRLPRRPGEEKPYDLILNLGLISNRHRQTDKDIDLYLLRNAEMTQIREEHSFAMQEQYAYEKTIQLINEFNSGGHTLIRTFPSGLPPANVGFVRAAIELLRQADQAALAFEVVHYRGIDREPSILLFK